MDAYEQLRRDARKARNEAIAEAEARYKRAIARINSLHSMMGQCKHAVRVRRIRRSPEGTPFNKLSILEATERVLLERGPSTLVELVVELQHRGCKPKSLPFQVERAIKSALHYHKDRFVRYDTFRWIVV